MCLRGIQKKGASAAEASCWTSTFGATEQAAEKRNKTRKKLSSGAEAH
jgi:hypothetical protein